jgi:hypothetical protein
MNYLLVVFKLLHAGPTIKQAVNWHKLEIIGKSESIPVASLLFNAAHKLFTIFSEKCILFLIEMFDECFTKLFQPFSCEIATNLCQAGKHLKVSIYFFSF